MQRQNTITRDFSNIKENSLHYISRCKFMKKHHSSDNLCPVCGQGTTRVRKVDYKLKDENGKEFIVPDIQVEVCDFCGECIFNMDAVSKARQIIGAPYKILIRLNPETHATLATRAQKSKRSITDEVYHLLEQSLSEVE